MGGAVSTGFAAHSSPKNEFLGIIPSFEVEANKPHDCSDVANNHEQAIKELIELRSKIRNALDKGKVLLEDDEKVIQDALTVLLNKAIEVERAVTPFLQSVASECGGELVGLLHKFKTRDSLERKVKGDLEAKKRSLAREGHSIDAINVLDMVNSIGDSLRYTMLIPDARYSQVVISTREKLNNLGNIKHKFKNFWDEGDMYQGINDTYRNTATNFVFELQYHTPGSWELKAECHIIYEKFRICHNPAEQQKLFEEGVRLAESLPIPPGVFDIPVLVKNPEPNVIAAYAYLIHTTGQKRQAALMQWFHAFVGDDGTVKVDVDDLPTIEAELVALMDIYNNQIPVEDLVQRYYFFGISVVVSIHDPDKYGRFAEEILKAMLVPNSPLIHRSKLRSMISPASTTQDNNPISQSSSPAKDHRVIQTQPVNDKEVKNLLMASPKVDTETVDNKSQQLLLDTIPHHTTQDEAQPPMNIHSPLQNSVSIAAYNVSNQWTPIIAVQEKHSGESDFDTLSTLIAPGLYVQCSIGSRVTLFPDDNLLFELTLTTEQAQDIAQRVATRRAMRVATQGKCDHQQYIDEMVDLWKAIRVPLDLEARIGNLLTD